MLQSLLPCDGQAQVPWTLTVTEPSALVCTDACVDGVTTSGESAMAVSAEAATNTPPMARDVAPARTRRVRWVRTGEPPASETGRGRSHHWLPATPPSRGGGGPMGGGGACPPPPPGKPP